jgi:hypothetical protein
MFGVCGIAEREITERTNTPGRLLVRVFQALQGFAILVGTFAASVAGFTILSITLGTWIS